MVDDLDHVPTKLEGSGPHSGEGALVGRMMALARETRLGETAVGPPVHLPAASVVPAAPPGFVLERELGRGGNGVVYLATQVGLNRPVALKTLKSASHPTAVIRFLAEAEAVAAVRHPNVVEVYQYGEDGGRPYLALEYCPGGDLAALADVRTWSPPEAATLMTGVADGVAAAHARGIVHRDLKPHNVLLVPAPGEPSTSVAWVPKVSDFGLAKRGGESNLTSTDSVMGTPAYMSPEQARGRPVDGRADLFSLGVVMYQMLTGRRPFTSTDTVAIPTSLALDTPLAPHVVNPEVPGHVSALVMELRQKEPGDRPMSAGAILAALNPPAARR